MKIVPLAAKKKLKKVLKRLNVNAALLSAVVVFLGSMIALPLRESHDGAGGKAETQENVAMTQKVTHLMQSYDAWRSMDNVVTAQGKGVDRAIDLARAKQIDAQLQKQFETEEQDVGLALAFERKLASDKMYTLYKQTRGIDGRPAYFLPGDDDVQSMKMRSEQARFMDKQGFAPTVAVATEIVTDAQKHIGIYMLMLMLGPTALTVGVSFGVAAGKKQLDKSIRRDEAAEREQAKAEREAEAARVAAETAETERRANLPVAVAEPIDRDISVRALKLAGKRDPKAGPAA